MSIKLVRYEGNTILPKNDVDLQKRFFTKSGFLSGCVISQVSSNVVRITSGKGIIQGGDFEVLQEDIQVVLPSSDVTTGWVYVEVDLSNTETPIAFKSILEVGGNEPNWVQNANFYETNGVYQLPILQYFASPTNIVDIFQKALYMTGVWSSVEVNEAPLYTATNYPVGAIVRYAKDGFIYRCKSAATSTQKPVEFPGLWEQTTLGAEIVSAKKPATTGVKSVVATSLTAGQVFTAPVNGVYQLKTTFTAITGYIFINHSNGQYYQSNPAPTPAYAQVTTISVNAGQTITITNINSINSVEVAFFPQEL